MEPVEEGRWAEGVLEVKMVENTCTKQGHNDLVTSVDENDVEVP